MELLAVHTHVLDLCSALLPGTFTHADHHDASAATRPAAAPPTCSSRRGSWHGHRGQLGPRGLVSPLQRLHRPGPAAKHPRGLLGPGQGLRMDPLNGLNQALHDTLDLVCDVLLVGLGCGLVGGQGGQRLAVQVVLVEPVVQDLRAGGGVSRRTGQRGSLAWCVG